MKYRIVQHEVSRTAAAIRSDNARIEREPFVDPVVAREQLGQKHVQLVRSDRRQEPESAEVHTQYRNAVGCNHARTVQQGPVTAERDEEIDGARLEQVRLRAAVMLGRGALDIGNGVADALARDQFGAVLAGQYAQTFEHFDEPFVTAPADYADPPEPIPA